MLVFRAWLFIPPDNDAASKDEESAPRLPAAAWVTVLCLCALHGLLPGVFNCTEREARTQAFCLLNETSLGLIDANLPVGPTSGQS